MSSQPAAAPSPVTPDRLMQMAWGYAPPLIIGAAVRHGLFDALAAGPRTVGELAEQTRTSARGVRAVANALVALGLLAKQNGRYALTPESDAFLVSTRPGFQGGFFRNLHVQLLPIWMHLGDALRTGRPPTAVNQEGPGSEFFNQLVEDIFPLSYGAARALGQALDLAAATQPVRVLDLAAGSGVWGIALAQQSPQVRVTAVDWPAVIPVTRRVAARHGLADRFTFVEGDLHAADFGNGHTIATLGHILHSEGEARSRALLKKTFNALAPGGTIAIAEFLVNDDRTGPINGAIFAVNMLVHTDEGDAFSAAEISAWLREAGFQNPRTLEAPGPSPLILATKPA